MNDLTLEDMKPLYEGLMDLIQQDQPTLAPDVMRLPVTEYTDPERWAREVALFRTTPMVLAFSSELSEPGSYWAMTRVGVPILLTRLQSGSVRLFINACRHRGVKVAPDGQGTAARLSCIYHGWTYGLDGKLLGIAERKIFGEVDKDCLGLKQLAVEERAGLIWGILTPGMALDLDGYLGPRMDTMIRKSRLDRYRIVNRLEVPAANWKLASEGYLESYHFKSLHKGTFITFIHPNILKFESHGPHTLFCTPAIGIKECDPNSLTELQRFVQISYTLFPGVELAFASDTGFGNNDNQDRALVGRLFANHVLPGDSPDKSITISRTMVNEDVAGTDRAAETEIWSTSTHNVVIKEDYPVVQFAQETLRSGAQECLIFGRNEIGIQHFHNMLHESID